VGGRDRPDNVVSMARLRGKVVDTGQSVEIDAPRRRRRKRGWRDHVSLVDIGMMTRLELSGQEYRVLIAVIMHIPEKGGSDAFCTMQEIADTLGIAHQSVSRTMKSLRDRNIIIRRSSKIGRWHVNAWLAFNGDFDSWNAEAESDPEPIWVRGVNSETGEVS
jgi:DNA-binding transcriptional ArsR family regulator